MTGVILQTKLHIPPLRPAHIQRHQLLDKLNDRLQMDDGRFGRKLTLVSAPPGFGKTTLISSWLQQLDQPATWLSLDEGDNEPGRFIYYVIAALQVIRRNLGDSALSLLQSPQPPSPETLLTLIINDLACLTGQVILVLDDYHVIHELGVHEVVTFLLNNQPPQLHLVIISREDPALPLHRLRGSGQMLGIYVKDLRFSTDEAALFLNDTMGLDLTTDEITALERRTEGWVAGLQLAALSLLDMPDSGEFVTAFAGDDRYITDYLFAEVIERLPAHIQNFLQKTAIIDRFCASLCDALLGVADLETNTNGPMSLPSQAIIEQLDRANMFIVTLDSKREWYRYHHLFVDFLRLSLRDLPASQIADLHRRAAAWHDQHGFTEEAIKHYLALKDFTQVAELIERVAIPLIAQGRLRIVFDWLDKLPNESVASRPLLCVCQAWILNITGQAAASEPLLQEAERKLETIEPYQAQQIKGLIDMIRAYQARRQGDLPKSVKLLRQASENLSIGDLLVRSTVNLNLGFNYLLMGELAQAETVLREARAEGKAAGAVYVTLIALALQGNSYVAQGKLRRAIATYEETIRYGLARNQGRPFPPAGYAYAGLGQVMYEQNQLREAEQLLTIAVQLGESISDWSMVRRGLLPLAWLKEMTGDSVAAQTLWRRALDVIQQAGSDRLQARLQAQWARMQLMHAASDSAALAATAAWAQTYREQRPDISSFQEVIAQMILAQVELAQGQVDEALRRLGRLAEAASASGQYDNLIKIQALQALAYDAKGDRTRALDKLSDAIVLSEPEGYVRTFVDLGLPLKRLLQKTTSRSPASNYIKQLLSSFQDTAQAETSSTQPDGSLVGGPLAEPFSDRELSMLRLMAAGLSNREIADELFLSVNTIKVYLSRMYGKLGVHRRAEAVAVAREHNLI